MLPEAFLTKMQSLLGEEYEAFLSAFDRESYHALRLNPAKTGRGAGLSFHMTPVSWEENGYYYDHRDQPGKHPYHEAGVYYIQEPSAMAVAPLLEVKPGERVLDLCAAPGGKSTQLGASLCGKGILVSNEIHPGRAKILSENIERMGITNACVTNETPVRLSEKFPEYFDKILVDAPCSGEGMFRKNETAREEWSEENVALCAARQDEILDCAAKMLRPGGRLVYSTCTFAPEENEGSVSRFLHRHPDFALIPIDKRKMGLPEGVCDGRPEWAEREGAEGMEPEGTDMGGPKTENRSGQKELTYTLRLWPQHVKGEGHFTAVFVRTGSVPEGYEPMPVGGPEKGVRGTDKELELWWEFWENTAIGGRQSAVGAVPCGDRFLRFGENLYLMPEGMPSLKGLKVLRPGLHLGSLRKNRFEPSHALALALSPQEVRHACHISARDAVTAAYLNGQTFSYDGEKGWYLVAVDGYSVGWGKLAGGIMKNHYPKGLRKG